MSFDNYIKDKKAFFFELDDVLFPAKDYLLQVYYLFAQFIEYVEQIKANEVLEFMRIEYEKNGTEQIFEKTIKQFDIPNKYQHNFDLLHKTARLPLKLLLYKNMLDFLQAIVVEHKQIFIVTSGDAEQQLNKIKQTEWHGLEKYLTVYFTDELNQTKAEVFNSILSQIALKPEEVLVIGSDNSNEKESPLVKLVYINALNLLK